MTRLAEIMPETTTDLYNACNPFVPPLVHANGIDIVQLIVQAKAEVSFYLFLFPSLPLSRRCVWEVLISVLSTAQRLSPSQEACRDV